MPMLLILASGALFGAGVTLSGMTNPMKVLNFMDLFGIWDPTLAFVMGGGLLTTMAGYRLVLGKAKPAFAERFDLPALRTIDGKLLGGAALFGIGWGLSGFCPGPAIASLIFGHVESLIFVVTMACGMALAKRLGQA